MLTPPPRRASVLWRTALDSFQPGAGQRRLRKLYVEPTTHCNLTCRTCVRRSWRDELGTMQLSTFERLLAGLRSPRGVTLSLWGFGEPLLHSEIVRMVGLAKQRGLAVEMVSNGLLLDPAMSAGLIAAGLDSLVISLDGSAAESHADVRQGADLGLILENLTAFRAIRERAHSRAILGIEHVLMRRNVAGLPRLIALAREQGAGFVILTNLLPYAPEMLEEVLYWNSAENYTPARRCGDRPVVIVPPLDRRLLPPESLAAVGIHGPDDNEPAGLVAGPAGFCRFVWEGAAAVGWNGDLSPCVPLLHTYNCHVLRHAKLIRKYVLGNVERSSVTELWNAPEYKKFREKVRRFEFSPCTGCGGCDLAESNEEDCFGNSFPVCGDCLWAKNVVLCP